MNKKLELELKGKLNNLFKDPEDITAPIELCGDKLIQELLIYSKEEIDYILNNEVYLTKLILRLHEYPTSMWTGRVISLFKVAIKTLKDIKNNLEIKSQITPKLLIQSLNIESLVEMSKFLERHNKDCLSNKQLIKYFEGLPDFCNIENPLPEVAKEQHAMLMLQLTEKLDRLDTHFNYTDNFILNLKEIRKYEKIKNF